MQRIRHVLVGLDLDATTGELTEGSRAATSRAVWLAGRTDAEVEFLYSTHEHPEAGPPSSAARAELEQLVESLGGSDVTLSVTSDEPAGALAQRVQSGTADLVVVGKRNHTRSRDRLLGSVSMQLIRSCPSPVWVVKPEHQARHQSILAATDLTAVGDRATEYGAYLASVEECDLWIVHAWQLPMDLQLSASRIGEAEFDRRCKAIGSEAREHILAVPGVSALRERAHTVVTRDTPERLILTAVEERDPDLVVMGTISRAGVSGILVGNTAERLLHKLDCSLLTIKPEVPSSMTS